MTSEVVHYLDNFWSQFFFANGRHPKVETYQAVSVLAGLIFYTFCFIFVVPFASHFFQTYKTLSFKNRMEWNMRGVSTIHAIISFAMAFKCLFMDDTFHEFTLLRSNYETDVTLCFSAGYFIYDSVITLLYFPHDIGGLVHHIVALVGWLTTSFYQIGVLFPTVFILTGYCFDFLCIYFL